MPGPTLRALHLLTLSAFAVAQPLFDVVSRQPEFFVARQSSSFELLMFTVGLSLLLPGLLLVLCLVLRLLGARVYDTLFVLAVGVLSTLVVLPPLNRLGVLPGPAIAAVAAAGGAGVAVLYLRSGLVRQFLTWLSPAILVFPALFLLTEPVADLFLAWKKLPPEPAQNLTDEVTLPSNVIMVVFDEFPVTSLMDEEGRVEANRFPAFARFSADAIWFTDATTVADETLYAVPALLSGTYPVHERLATASHHPRNLFSLLSPYYRINALEPVTDLCPKSACPRPPPSPGERLASAAGLVSDVTAVYLHLVVPAQWSATLPAIDQNWSGFSWGEAGVPLVRQQVARVHRTLRRDRETAFRDFVHAIEPGSPTLHYLHVMLPHGPYNYLPSGRRYGLGGRLPGIDGERWLDDPNAVIQAYQRHLLQLRFTDRLLGELLERLTALGLYEDSLIVLAADHGVSFRPGDARRPLTETNFADILPVPLLIKLPHDAPGKTDTRNAELIDVLPTIADVLGFELEWELDGHSLLGPPPDRPDKRAYYRHATRTFEVPHETLRRARDGAVMRKQSLLGTRPFPSPVNGAADRLVGRPVAGDSVGLGDGPKVTLDQAAWFDAISLADRFVPAYLTGRIYGDSDDDVLPYVAVAVNGIIQAIAPAVRAGSSRANFSAVIPDTALRDGRNEVDIYTLGHDGALQRVSRELRAPYRLEVGSGVDRLVSPDGGSTTIELGAVKGFLDTVRERDGVVSFNGWAADVARGEIATDIVFCREENCFFAGPPNMIRRDVVEAFQDRGLRRSGFDYDFPVGLIGPAPAIRVFAVSNAGVASELGYPGHYR